MSKRAEELALEIVKAYPQHLFEGHPAQFAIEDYLTRYGQEVREAAALGAMRAYISKNHADRSPSHIAKAIREMPLP